MSRHGSSDSSDDFLFTIFIILVIIGVVYFFVGRYGDALVPVWRVVRTVELMLTFQFDAVVTLWDGPVRWGDATFEKVNASLYHIYRLVVAPFFLIFAIAYARTYGGSFNTVDTFTMDLVMTNIWKRFPWLAEVSVLKGNDKLLSPNLLRLKAGSFEFEFKETNFKEGMQPLDFIGKYGIEDGISRLAREIGPRLKLDTDGNIVWQDMLCKRVMEQLIVVIPDKSPRKGMPSMRKTAWERCIKAACYERTFVLHLFTEAKKFMVFAPVRFLWLRTLTGVPSAYTATSNPFILWRALLSHIRRPFVEASVILNQFHYENVMYDHLKKHPEDEEYVRMLLNQGPRTVEASVGLREVLEKYESFRA